MRDFKNMKRQRGRNRSGGGSSNGGGGKPQQNANRAFDSNGPDNVKIRGHAQHVFEKYQQYARDAFSSGDRVLAENYLQHADHYFRVLRTIQPQRSPSEILGRDVLASGLDIDFEEEFEASEDGGEVQTDAPADLNGAERADGRRDERYEPRRDGEFAPRDRNDGRRDGYDSREPRPEREFRQDRYGEGQPRNRNEGQVRDRGGEGQSRDRQDRPQGGERSERDRVNPDRQDGRDRPEGGEPRRDNRRFEPRRDDRPYGRDARDPREPRGDDRRLDERRPDDSRSEMVAADPLPVIAPVAVAPITAVGTFTALSPEAEGSPVLRSEDGGMSEAPAFLQPASGEDAEARKPRARRRRAPRSFEASDTEGGAASPSEGAED